MHYIRRVYATLDLLSDLGGLSSSCTLLSLTLVYVTQYYGYYQFVMNDLFVKKRRKQQTCRLIQYQNSMLEPNEDSLNNSIQWNTWQTIKLNLHTFCWPMCPKLFQCCQLNRDQRLRTKAYSHVLNELSVSKIVKQIRVLKAAAKQNMSPKHWKQLKMQTELMAYSELESNPEFSQPKDEDIDLSGHLSASYSKDMTNNFSNQGHSMSKALQDTPQKHSYPRTMTLVPSKIRQNQIDYSQRYIDTSQPQRPPLRQHTEIFKDAKDAMNQQTQQTRKKRKKINEHLGKQAPEEFSGMQDLQQLSPILSSTSVPGQSYESKKFRK